MENNEQRPAEHIYNRLLAEFGVIPAFALHDSQLGTTCFAVYASLCVYANKEGYAWPSQATIARELNIADTKTLRRALVELERKGYIKIQKSKTIGRGNTSTYYIVDKPKKAVDNPVERKGELSPPSQNKGDKRGEFSPSKRGKNLPTNNTRNIEQENSFFSQRKKQHTGTVDKGTETDPITGEDMGFALT